MPSSCRPSQTAFRRAPTAFRIDKTPFRNGSTAFRNGLTPFRIPERHSAPIKRHSATIKLHSAPVLPCSAITKPPSAPTKPESAATSLHSAHAATPPPNPFPDGEGELVIVFRNLVSTFLELETSPPSPPGKGLGEGVAAWASQNVPTLGPGGGEVSRSRRPQKITSTLSPLPPNRVKPPEPNLTPI